VTASTNGLLDRAVAGDLDAIAQLLERHGPAVRQGIEGKIHPRWQAVLSVDDVMQETYIDAFVDVSRFEPRGEDSFVAWLVTLARRNLLDAVRMLDAAKRGKNRRRIKPGATMSSLAALWDQLGGDGATPSREVARHEAYNSLQQAIERLPERDRVVVRMYDLEGRSVDEIAERLQRTPGAVFMIRGRALRKIRECLGSASRFLSKG